MCNGEKKAVRIATVGSGKSDAWWDEAYSYGVGENAWYFGVDGIDKKSELYRVGSDFDDVWERMKQGRDARTRNCLAVYHIWLQRARS